MVYAENIDRGYPNFQLDTRSSGSRRDLDYLLLLAGAQVAARPRAVAAPVRYFGSRAIRARPPSKRISGRTARLVCPCCESPIYSGFPPGPIGGIIAHGRPSKNNLRRHARPRCARRADLLLGLSLQPSHRDQRRPMGRGRAACSPRYRASLKVWFSEGMPKTNQSGRARAAVKLHRKSTGPAHAAAAAAQGRARARARPMADLPTPTVWRERTTWCPTAAGNWSRGRSPPPERTQQKARR